MFTKNWDINKTSSTYYNTFIVVVPIGMFISACPSLEYKFIIFLLWKPNEYCMYLYGRFRSHSFLLYCNFLPRYVFNIKVKFVMFSLLCFLNV